MILFIFLTEKFSYYVDLNTFFCLGCATRGQIRRHPATATSPTTATNPATASTTAAAASTSTATSSTLVMDLYPVMDLFQHRQIVTFLLTPLVFRDLISQLVSIF